jgi:hypothetical protein
MVIDCNCQSFLSLFLTNDILIEDFLNLLGLRDIAELDIGFLA